MQCKVSLPLLNHPLGRAGMTITSMKAKPCASLRYFGNVMFLTGSLIGACELDVTCHNLGYSKLFLDTQQFQWFSNIASSPLSVFFLTTFVNIFYHKISHDPAHKKYILKGTHTHILHAGNQIVISTSLLLKPCFKYLNLKTTQHLQP